MKNGVRAFPTHTPVRTMHGGTADGGTYVGVRRPVTVIVGFASAAALALASAAGAHTTSKDAATTVAPAPTTTVAPAPSVPSRAVGAEHVVVAGDTLTGIARRYGVDPDEIAAMNDLRHRDLVKVGQHLKVPGIAVPETLPARLLARPERVALLPRFVHWADRNSIPADLLMATTWLESGWNNEKVSSVGAIGIGQLMPDTARFVSRELIGVELDPRVPEHNIRMSARFLRFLLQQTGGDETRALYGYYQGLRSVSAKGAYTDTKRYARDVQALRALFKVDGTSGATAVVAATTVAPAPKATSAAGTAPSGRKAASRGASPATAVARTTSSASAPPAAAPPTTVGARVPVKGAATTRVQARAQLAAAPPGKDGAGRA